MEPFFYNISHTVSSLYSKTSSGSHLTLNKSKGSTMFYIILYRLELWPTILSLSHWFTLLQGYLPLCSFSSYSDSCVVRTSAIAISVVKDAGSPDSCIILPQAIQVSIEILPHQRALSWSLQVKQQFPSPTILFPFTLSCFFSALTIAWNSKKVFICFLSVSHSKL